MEKGNGGGLRRWPLTSIEKRLKYLKTNKEVRNDVIFY
jgi:hypothetical protein